MLEPASRKPLPPEVRRSQTGFGGLGWIGGVAGGAGAYESTDIGKITAAAFLDAHNKLVTQLRAIPAGSANTDNAGYVTSTQVNFRSGPSPKAPSYCAAL